MTAHNSCFFKKVTFQGRREKPTKQLSSMGGDFLWAGTELKKINHGLAFLTANSFKQTHFATHSPPQKQQKDVGGRFLV